MAGTPEAGYAAEKTITIGTAGELGVYYPAGGAICRLVKRGFKEHGISCSVKPTSGSVYNLKALRSGTLDMVLAQSDWIYHDSRGSDDFAASGPDKALRSVFLLHTEAFTVLVRADSGINTVQDLKQHRIGIADDGSGMRATAEEFFKAEGWNKDVFTKVDEFKPDQQGDALCAGKVDAILFMAGHPNGTTQEATDKCKMRLVAVKGPEIDALLHKNPYYVRVSIPGGMYKGSPRSTQTFGVKAALVTSSRISEEVVYQVVKAVFDNLDNFKTLHPVFSTLDKSQMIAKGLIVPLHPGALRYYHEAGLLK
jgi:uncharacterized protein